MPVSSTPTTPMTSGVNWRQSPRAQLVECARAMSCMSAISTSSSTATAAGVRSRQGELTSQLYRLIS
jgi:hypothetical protein